MSKDIKEPQSDWPTSYLFQDQDGWHSTDKQLTKEINHHVFLRADFDTAGRAFYPQWPEPTYKTTTKVAWILKADGERAARWRWIERDHQKWHADCQITTPGRCRSRVLQRLSYDPAKRFWTRIEDAHEQENQCKPPIKSSS